MGFDRNDYGIIFKGATEDITTYVDIWGKTRDAVLLTAGVEQFMGAAVESAVAHVGNAVAFSLEVDVALHPGDSLAVTLHGELSDTVVDATSPALQTLRNDTGAEEATQVFATAGRVMLQTDNLSSIVNAAVGVSLTGGGSEGTVITVRMRVLR